MRAERRQRNREASRGVRDQERPMPLIAVPEGFPQLVHGLEGIAIEQRPHALPQQALAAQFGPDGSEQGTAQLLGLVHQKRQHHHHGKHHRQMLLAMAVVVLKVIALIFQRIERLIFDLPPRPATAHEGYTLRLLTRRSVTQLKCWTLSLPISQYSIKLTRTSALRGIERHVIDKAKAMHQPRGAVVPLIIR